MDWFYFCTIILTELMMIAMTLHVARYSGFKRVQKVWYLMTFGAIMFCAAAEFAVHCGFYDPAFSGLLTVVTVAQFSIAPLLPFLFAGSLGLRGKTSMAVVFFALNLGIEIAAAVYGWIFYFDAEGYHRGEGFFVYEIFYILSLLYLFVCMVLVGKKFKHRDMSTIGMVIVVLIAGIVPMAIFKINVTYTAIGICASLCYIYYNDLVQQDIQAELISNQKKLSVMQEHMISGLANFIENRDMETGEHITRTSDYVKLLAECARADGVYTKQLSDRFISLLHTLAPMHDIGKIVVSDVILKKPGKLTPEEYEEMKKHAEAGGRMVREVLNGVTDEEYLQFASDISTYHHERWDGSGYPAGLAGEQIPLCARIMALADVYDALVSVRCYKKAMTPEQAFEIIAKESGTHFDPKLAKVFLDHKDAFIHEG